MLPDALDLLVARQLFLILHTQIVHQIRVVLRRNYRLVSQILFRMKTWSEAKAI